MVHMTIKEIAHHLHSIAVSDQQSPTKLQLTTYLSEIFRGNDTKSFIFELALPDGWWHCKIVKYADRPDGYDYYIPETREQEKRLTA